MDTIDRIREALPSPAIGRRHPSHHVRRPDQSHPPGRDGPREFFKDQVFQTVIPRSIRLAEAPSFGKPILAYDPRSKGAESYIKLAKEILDHEQNRTIQRKALGKGLGPSCPREPRLPPASRHPLRPRSATEPTLFRSMRSTPTPYSRGASFKTSASPNSRSHSGQRHHSAAGGSASIGRSVPAGCG